MVCPPQGQSAALVESIGGDERDQTGAETAIRLHAGPVVPSYTITPLNEGTTQQPAGQLPQFLDFLSLSGKYFFGCSWVEIFFGGGDVYVFNFADPSVMEKRSPGQRLPQLEQTVAEQLQQGAGMCSVLDTTGG